MQSDDPSVIRMLAVHADDVVTALEANVRGGGDVVLRVTPPFAGRQRARLHRADRDSDDSDPEPLYLDPGLFVADPPRFPTPDDTEDELREAGDYSPERHREAHAAAVERWRESVRECFRDAVTLPGGGEVDVAVLG